ncbi:LAFA_0G19108g1_1 [Lachancea sp. 'fantastica']|nr:LAFA_0G19108g1_1 [Lachancea sp. 'fantastica']
MLRFVVSVENASETGSKTPASSSSFRILNWHQGKLTMEEMKLYKRPSSFSNITEMCYLRNSGRQNHSSSRLKNDYLFVCSDDGFIQVFPDIQASNSKKKVLKPRWFLTCNVNVAHCDTKVPIVSLDYLDGMLYCLCEDGQLSVFILNLPDTYIKSHSPVFAKDAMGLKNTDFSLAYRRFRFENLTAEDLKFVTETAYTGYTRSSNHPFSYLVPAHAHFRDRKEHLYGLSNLEAPCFQPSFTLSLGKNVGHLRINPFNKLSFFTGTLSGRLMLHKISITPAYLLYYKRLKSFIKQAVQEGQENTWTLCATNESSLSNRFSGTVWRGDLLGKDPLDAIEAEQLSMCADDRSRQGARSLQLRSRSGVPELQHYFCWREAVPSKLKSRGVAGESNARTSLKVLKVKPPVVRKKRKLSQRVQWALKNEGNLTVKTHDDDYGTENTIGRAIFEFGSFDENSNSTDQSSDAFHSTAKEAEKDGRGMYLPSFYRSLKILSMDGRSKLKALQPAATSQPCLIFDPNNDAESLVKKLRRVPRDRWLLQWLFKINERYHLAISADGVMLCNSSQMPNSCPLSLKKVNFTLGLILDALVLVRDSKTCQSCHKCRGDMALSLEIAVTCVDNLVMVIGVNFALHSEIGEWQVLDIVRLPEPTKALGKLTVLEFIKNGSKKRRYNNNPSSTLANGGRAKVEEWKRVGNSAS